MKSENGREMVDRKALEMESGKEWVKRFLKQTKPCVRMFWKKVEW